MALPSTQISRPLFFAATAIVFSLARLDAKVVATTKPLELRKSSSKFLFSKLSDRPECLENTFVLSHIKARMLLLVAFFIN